MSVRSFTLNKAIWNPALYNRVREIWFADLPASAATPSEESVKRWFTNSPVAKASFDKICHGEFNAALESISPKVYPLKGLSNEEIAAPFVSELQSSNDEENSRTALSLSILLDQIPRNLFRSSETLPLVYNHYDPISISLARYIQATNPRLDLHPYIRSSWPYRVWFYMPLMHSEDINDHKMFDTILDEHITERRNEGNEEAVKYGEDIKGFEKMHRGIIDQFGRYPHRNKFMGRETTKEEEDYMKAGGHTFGIAE